LPRGAGGPSFAQRIFLGVDVKPAFVLPAALCAALATCAAAAAELPSRPKPGATPAAATPAARTCHIDGQAGIMLPGSDACLHIGGSVSVQTTFGGSRSNDVQ
jgi:hypothetical protein